MAMTDQQHSDVQLAFRQEGKLINAYVERTHGNPLIVLLGSINGKLCEQDPRTLTEWRATMAGALSRFVERRSGEPALFVNARTEPSGGCA